MRTGLFEFKARDRCCERVVVSPTLYDWSPKGTGHLYSMSYYEYNILRVFCLMKPFRSWSWHCQHILNVSSFSSYLIFYRLQFHLSPRGIHVLGNGILQISNHSCKMVCLSTFKFVPSHILWFYLCLYHFFANKHLIISLVLSELPFLTIHVDYYIPPYFLGFGLVWFGFMAYQPL